MLCAIWYHLYNLKNVKNIHGGKLLLVKLQTEALFKVNNGNTRKICKKICLKLIIKTPERRHQLRTHFTHCSGVLIDFEELNTGLDVG